MGRSNWSYAHGWAYPRVSGELLQVSLSTADTNSAKSLFDTPAPAGELWQLALSHEDRPDTKHVLQVSPPFNQLLGITLAPHMFDPYVWQTCVPSSKFNVLSQFLSKRKTLTCSTCSADSQNVVATGIKSSTMRLNTASDDVVNSGANSTWNRRFDLDKRLRLVELVAVEGEEGSAGMYSNTDLYVVGTGMWSWSCTQRWCFRRRFVVCVPAEKWQHAINARRIHIKEKQQKQRVHNLSCDEPVSEYIREVLKPSSYPTFVENLKFLKPRHEYHYQV